MRHHTFTRKTLLASLAIGGLLLGHAAQAGSHEAGAAAGAAIRIGVFDAQAVFGRYPGQQQLQAQGQQMQAEMQQAAQAQDQQRMQDLQTRMQELHRNTIESFFEAVQAALPQIAREANVQVVVQEVQFKAEGVEEVDVTQALATALQVAAPAAPEAPAAVGFEAR